MKSYFKQIIHTQVFSLLNILAGCFTIFILVKSLKTAEYGDYVLIQGFIGISGMIFSQNLYTFTRMHIPGATVEVQYAYLKTVLIVVLIPYAGAVATVELSGFSKYIWNLIEVKYDLRHLVVSMLALELINLEFMRYFIAVKQVYLKNYAQFIQKVVVLLGSVALAFATSFRLEDFLCVYIFGQIIVSLIFVKCIDLSVFFKSKFMAVVVKKGYAVALPLLPAGLMSFALNYTDTLMISKYVNKDVTAQYGLASQIVLIAMMMIGTAVVLTLFPYATHAHNDGKHQLRSEYFVKMFNFGICMAVLCYFLLVVNSYFVVSTLGLVHYRNVPLYLNVLALFPFFHLVYNVSSHHLQLLQVFKIQVLIASFVILENAALNYVFINLFGALGAAFASLLSFITLACAFLLVSIRRDPRLLLVLRKSLNGTVILAGTLMIISAITVSLYFYQDVKTVIVLDVAGLLVSYYLFLAFRKKDSL